MDLRESLKAIGLDDNRAFQNPTDVDKAVLLLSGFEMLVGQMAESHAAKPHFFTQSEDAANRRPHAGSTWAFLPGLMARAKWKSKELCTQFDVFRTRDIGKVEITTQTPNNTELEVLQIKLELGGNTRESFVLQATDPISRKSLLDITKDILVR